MVVLELEPELLGADGAGVLGALVLPEALPDVLLWPEVLPELAPEPLFAPKWASHSARETCPSLFLSTIEKLGAEADAPADPLVVPDALLCPLVLPLAPAPAEPLVDVEGLAACELVLAPAPAEPLLIEPDAAGLCALVLPLEDDLLASFADTAPDSARSAAAVELTRIFSIMCVLLRLKKG